MLPNKGSVWENKKLEIRFEEIKNSRQIGYFEIARAFSAGEKSNTHNWTDLPSLDLQVNTNWISSARQPRVTKGTYAKKLEFMLRIKIK
jgi:hypothetical protein